MEFDMHDIWKQTETGNPEIPDTQLIIRRQSTDLLEKFVRQTRLENSIAMIVLIIMIAIGLIQRDNLILFFSIVPILSVAFGLVTLNISKSIVYTNNLSSYIKSAIAFYKYFIISFLISVQVVLSIILFVISSEETKLNWPGLSSDEKGMSILMVFLFIELSMISYILLFHWPHLKKLNALKRQYDLT